MSGDRYIITDQNASYFLTMTIVDWVDVFIRPVYKKIIVDSLNYCIEQKGLTLFSWCLMTNHLHLMAEARPGYKLSHIIRDFKKFTAYTILKAIVNEPESRRDWMLYRFEFAGKFKRRIEKYHFWQDGYYAIFLDPLKPDMFQTRMNYIHENPVRAGIVEYEGEYLYSSARDYAGRKGLVKVVLI
ncbi:MAG: transposase [Chitinophagaceae bacterium]|nr:transposase [Chitinophagaceae bacterium]